MHSCDQVTHVDLQGRSQSGAATRALPTPPCHLRMCARNRASGKRGSPLQHQPLGSPVGDPLVSRNQPEPSVPGLLTIADLGLHEGGGWQAGPDGITEATLRVQALGRAALGQPSWAQRHALRWRLWQ